MFEEITAKLFTKMGKDTLKTRKHRVPYRINQRRNMLRYTLIKVMKTKDRENIKKQQGKATNNIQKNFHKLIS